MWYYDCVVLGLASGVSLSECLFAFVPDDEKIDISPGPALTKT